MAVTKRVTVFWDVIPCNDLLSVASQEVTGAQRN
jgi:hypothetical protein